MFVVVDLAVGCWAETEIAGLQIDHRDQSAGRRGETLKAVVR
jgi:hypothetical protein